MKKIISFMLVLTLLTPVFSGCKKEGSETIDKTTETSSNVTTTTEIQKEEIKFDSIVTDTNNPIDKKLLPAFDEASSTSQLNKASSDYLKAWENELSNVVELCKKQNIPQYNEEEYQNILNDAQQIYDEQIQKYEGGSGATASAMNAKSEQIKKATYYYIALYKQNNSSYQYKFK